MKKNNFESFSNKKLYQTLSLPIFNKIIKIPFFYPSVSWKKHKYIWEYKPLQLKKEWMIKKSKNNNSRYLRYLKQYDASGHITWFSKQVITNATNDYIIVNEYDMLNNKKLIGTVKYTLVV